MAMRRYLAAAGGLSLLLLSAVFILNWWVDPVALDWIPGAKHFPLDYRYEREVRYNMITAMHPDVLILGASQAGIGIDPRSPVLHGERPYNGAITGGTLSEIDRLERHAAAIGPVGHTTILMPDYTMSRGSPPSRFNDIFLGGGGPGGVLHELVARTSLAMLVSSVKEVMEWLGYGRPYAFPTGQLRPNELEAQIRAHGGVHGDFDATVETTAHGLRQSPISVQDTLADIIGVACQQQINLTILTAPSHVYYDLVVRALGQWPDYVAWLRMLVQTASSAPCQVKVWDFSLVNPVVTEPVPPAGSQDEMAFYYDIVHFKAEVGQAMLAIAFGYHSNADGLTGELLTPQTIDAVIGRVDASLRAYAAAHPDVVAHVEQIVRATQ
jgi:hypothetical protein